MPRQGFTCIFGLIMTLVCVKAGPLQSPSEHPATSLEKRVIDAHGAIIRGDVTKKQIALVFTGDEFAEGGEHILQMLQRKNIRGSFFLTGNFYKNAAFRRLIRKLKEQGHYLGAHSDKHLLYADWTKRDSLLVTREEFRKDLLDNYARMKAFGIKAPDAPYFLPPYEWYNKKIAAWTSELGFQLINFSPGTRSAADYTYPEMGHQYVASDAIYRSIIQREEMDPNGLNGFILLVHIGTDPRRKDKFYLKLGELVEELASRHYTFVSITELLEGAGAPDGEKKK